MRINITARHFKMTDKIKDYANKEVFRLKKYYDGIIDVDIVLGWEKKDRIAEINISVFHTLLNAQERSEDMLLAIHGAVNKLERQIIKYKERLHGFEHEKTPTSVPTEENTE